MSGHLVCRGCGRRVRVPDGVNPRKARCSKCRTKLAAPDPAATPTPDPYRAFVDDSQAIGRTEAPRPTHPPDADPPPEVLSLDDAEQIDSPSSRRPAPRVTRLGGSAAAPAEDLPPPFRFAVRVVSDTRNRLRGAFRGVLTPYGLFLESLPNKPLIFAPIGTPTSATGSVVVIRLPDGVLSLRFGGVAFPDQLAADTAGFLAGRRPVPLPTDYRRPWWLAGVGALLAFGLAAGPVMLAEDNGIDLWIGLSLGAVFVAMATAANTAVALRARLPVGGKVALMTGVGAAALALFVLGSMEYFAGQKEPDEPEPAPPSPPVVTGGLPTPTPQPPEPEGPPTHFELVYRQGKTRLDDGPADVTALAVSPHGTVAVGYADGSTLVWALDQATFEAPRTGPRADGAVRRIEFDPAGKFAFLACDAGLVAAPFDTPPHTPLLIPGEHVAIRPDPNRERFAAVRAGRLHVRYAPMDLAKDPPAGRAVNGFVVSTPKDETVPFGGFAAGTVPPGGKPTFLAWHPAGRLVCGRPNGTITAMPTGTPGVLPVVILEHKAAVRAWAASAGGDFATGDDAGFIGFWPEKSMKPTKFKAGAGAIRGLAFNPRRGELAAVDAAGWVSVWHPTSGTKLFAVKPKPLPRAVAYGPNEDLLMIADGKGVEVWWLPALAGQAENP